MTPPRCGKPAGSTQAWEDHREIENHELRIVNILKKGESRKILNSQFSILNSVLEP